MIVSVSGVVVGLRPLFNNAIQWVQPQFSIAASILLVLSYTSATSELDLMSDHLVLIFSLLTAELIWTLERLP